MNTTELAMLSSYTLCSVALKAYNITDGSLPEDAYDNTDWYSEYQRVCFVNPTALPTVGFNTSISLSITDDDTVTVPNTAATKTASAGAGMTTSGATATSTALSISPDGTCGFEAGYTCAGSQFGDCCSIYGYW
jgi:hypothetical protein